MSEQRESTPSRGLVAWAVEAAGGSAGTVDEATTRAPDGSLAAAVGLIFGRHVVVGLDAVDCYDREARTLHVSCAAAELGSAPEHVDPSEAASFEKPL